MWWRWEGRDLIKTFSRRLCCSSPLALSLVMNIVLTQPKFYKVLWCIHYGIFPISLLHLFYGFFFYPGTGWMKFLCLEFGPNCVHEILMCHSISSNVVCCTASSSSSIRVVACFPTFMSDQGFHFYCDVMAITVYRDLLKISFFTKRGNSSQMTCTEKKLKPPLCSMYLVS